MNAWERFFRKKQPPSPLMPKNNRINSSITSQQLTYEMGFNLLCINSIQFNCTALITFRNQIVIALMLQNIWETQMFVFLQNYPWCLIIFRSLECNDAPLAFGVIELFGQNMLIVRCFKKKWISQIGVFALTGNPVKKVRIFIALSQEPPTRAICQSSCRKRNRK